MSDTSSPHQIKVLNGITAVEGEMTEIRVFTDMMTDGSMPGRNSILSFTSVAYDSAEDKPVGSFSRNLTALIGANNHFAGDGWEYRDDLIERLLAEHAELRAG